MISELRVLAVAAFIISLGWLLTQGMPVIHTAETIQGD